LDAPELFNVRDWLSKLSGSERVRVVTFFLEQVSAERATNENILRLAKLPAPGKRKRKAKGTP